MRYGRRVSEGSLSLLPPCKPDSTSLPGQIGSLVDQVGRRVHNYLILRVVLTMTRWIFGSESIFLPVFPVLQGGTGRSHRAGDGGAARGEAASPQVVGVLAFADRYPDAVGLGLEADQAMGIGPRLEWAQIGGGFADPDGMDRDPVIFRQ